MDSRPSLIQDDGWIRVLIKDAVVGERESHPGGGGVLMTKIRGDVLPDAPEVLFPAPVDGRIVGRQKGEGRRSAGRDAVHGEIEAAAGNVDIDRSVRRNGNRPDAGQGLAAVACQGDPVADVDGLQ